MSPLLVCDVFPTHLIFRLIGPRNSNPDAIGARAEDDSFWRNNAAGRMDLVLSQERMVHFLRQEVYWIYCNERFAQDDHDRDEVSQVSAAGRWCARTRKVAGE